MAYVPPGVSNQSFAPGVHAAIVVDFKQILDPAKLAKFNAQVVYIATYRNPDTATEIDQVIKFNGTKADFYSGQTIDRLHMAAGMDEPAPEVALDVPFLAGALSGANVLVEVNDKGYVNGIQVPMSAASGDDLAF